MDQSLETCKILVVDDDLGLLSLMQRKLQRQGFATDTVASGSEAISWLGSNRADLMLLDYKLPDMTGAEVIESLKEKKNVIPFIVVTGCGDEKVAVNTLKAGARDYLIKDRGLVELLPSVVDHTLKQLEQEKRLAAAEKALKDSEAQYHGIFTFATEAFFVLNFDGRIIDANPRALRLYGYTHDELMGLDFKKLIHPESEQLHLQLNSDVRSKGQFQTETVGAQHDGTLFDVEIKGTTFEYKGRKQILVILNDISERKWAEEELKLSNQQLRISESALREREARLRAIFQEAAIGIALVDLGGRAIESNPALQEMLGYSSDQLRQEVFTKFIHADDVETNRHSFEDLARGKCNHYRIETRYLNKDGKLVWVHQASSLVRSSEGKPNYVINMMENATNRKEFEQALAESEERFRILAESSFEGILIHDKGYALDANQTFADMFGYDLSKIIGKNSMFLIAPESRDVIAKHIRSESADTYQAKGIKKDGTIFPMEIYGRMINFQGRPARVAAVRDISQRLQLEEELRLFTSELERSNRELEHFAQAVYHDVQKPLRQIASDGGGLEQCCGKNNPQTQKLIDRICSTAKNLEQFTENLLIYSRARMPQEPFEPVYLQDAVQGALDNLKQPIEDKNAQVKVKPLPVVSGNQKQLQQLFENLIDNAIKFHGDDVPQVEISCRDVPEGWEITVADNGIGVDPKYRERIFTMFERLNLPDKYSGVGVGLSVSKKIVEHHGGRIWLDPGPGPGSTFHIILPKKNENRKK